MSKLTVRNFEELTENIGKDLGPSEYLKITQEQINLFAEATHDHQWIHVDVERARNESPFKSTIAHGYLTVSLLPCLIDEVIEVNNSTMTVNYEIEKMRFNQAVLVDDEVRLKAQLVEARNLRGVIKVVLHTVIEVKDKPEIGKLKAQKEIKEVDKELGDEGRILVRYSGTQNVCRVMVEGKDKKLIEKLCDKVVVAIKKEIGV